MNDEEMRDEKRDEPAQAPAADPVVTSDGLTIPTPGAIKSEHGAQVHLTGEARAAARGGLHGDIVSNTMARDAAIARGEAGNGMTPDGSTPDGRLPPDVKDGADQAVYSEPDKGEGMPGNAHEDHGG